MKTKDSKSAKAFVEYWQNRGAEKQETARFWLELLREVLGVPNPTRVIEFEKPVKLTHTNFIDGYIPATKVLIEQKRAGDDLHKRHPQSDGTTLTPFEQAKRYADELPYSLRPRWIVVCNFQEFLIYDLERPHADPEQILLKDLAKEFYRLRFLVDDGNDHLKKELEVSVKATELVGRIYDKVLEQYLDPTDSENLHSLNILCVRLVFCLYAEDAGLFPSKTSFHDYLSRFEPRDLRRALIDLFITLDTPADQRDPYLDVELAKFPYVNGGLFNHHAGIQHNASFQSDILIPPLTDEIKQLLLQKASADFDWTDISPTIFGALFESTLNPDTRRKGGMHYTSIENIHKVIDPLFMDDLQEEFSDIVEAYNDSPLQKRNRKLLDFQNKLASLSFLDPACGSGNFLTETFISLRKLENRVIFELTKGQGLLGFEEVNPIKVNINQFYGIEINDFAVDVAKTALWIAENQMLQETERIINRDLNTLPLKSYHNIRKGNALREDWNYWEISDDLPSVIAQKTYVYPLKELSENTNMLFEPRGHYGEINVYTDDLSLGRQSEARREIRVAFDYIMGNPPFVGNNQMNVSQREDLKPFFPKNKTMDYVACWFVKAARLMQNAKTKCAFIATSSITQGEQMPLLWENLCLTHHIHIDFAWRTFKWDSKSTRKAAVHCVVIGFSASENNGTYRIYLNDGSFIDTKNISPYLMDTDTVFVKSRSKPLCNVPAMRKVNQPTDGGNLIIEACDYENFLRKEPAAARFIKPLIGADEFINNKKRYCLWLVNAHPHELRGMPLVKERVAKCRELRLRSSDPNTRKLADTPHLFRETVNPKTALIIPRVSSENRQYVPIGFIDDSVIFTDAVQSIANATLYHFGVLTSNIHNAWMRAVCGRLENRYRYSKDIVYNNFPWCSPTEEQKAKIESTAQAILDARGVFPDASLSDLYDETLMPKPLRDAHRANDKAVMEAYGFRTDMPEEEIVAELFKMYEVLTK